MQLTIFYTPFFSDYEVIKYFDDSDRYPRVLREITSESTAYKKNVYNNALLLLKNDTSLTKKEKQTIIDLSENGSDFIYILCKSKNSMEKMIRLGPYMYTELNENKIKEISELRKNLKNDFYARHIDEIKKDLEIYNKVSTIHNNLTEGARISQLNYDCENIISIMKLNKVEIPSNLQVYLNSTIQVEKRLILLIKLDKGKVTSLLESNSLPIHYAYDLHETDVPSKPINYISHDTRYNNIDSYQKKFVRKVKKNNRI